jgi:protein-disulfide isomerase
MMDMRFAIAAVLCLSLLPAQEKPKSALDKAQLEAYVRHLLAVIPEVQVKIDDPKPSAVSDLLKVDVHFTYGTRSQDETYFVTKDGKHIVRGLIFDVAKNPFQEDLDKLKTDSTPNYGTAGAPVTLVVFGDFQCPVCKAEAQVMRENLLKTFPTQARVYFKDFPLESIHPWAKPASIAGRCVFRQSPSAFWKYHDWIYEHQEEINPENLKDKVMEFAKTASDVDGLQLGRCMDSKATEADVEAAVAQGHSLGVDATPTLFINGRRLVGNYPWPNMEQIVNGELNYQKTVEKTAEKPAAPSANDPCCEVKIPSPLNK